MKCLLCAKSLQTEITFTNLLCFKKEEELVCESCISSFESIGGNHCPSCFKKRFVNYLSRLSILV